MEKSEKKNLAILIDKVVIAFVEGKFLELFSWNERNRIDAIWFVYLRVVAKGHYLEL